MPSDNPKKIDDDFEDDDDDDEWEIYSAEISQLDSGDIVFINSSWLGDFLVFAAVVFVLIGLMMGLTYTSLGVVFVGLVIGVCRGVLVESYIVDFNRQALILRRQFLGFELNRQLRLLNTLHAVMVDSKRISNENRSGWDYGLSLLPQHGKKIDILPPRQTGHRWVKADGSRLAELLKLEFIPGSPEQYTYVEETASGPTVTYGPPPSPIKVVAKVLLFALLFILVILAVIFLVPKLQSDTIGRTLLPLLALIP